MLLPAGGIGRKIGVLAGGTAVGQGVALIATPILTRLYTSSDYGYMQLYFALMTFLVGIVSLRYELAIVLPVEDEVAASVTVAGLASTFLITGCVVIVAVVATLHPHWAGRFSELQKYYWIIPASVLAAGIYQVLAYWALRRHDYRAIATTKITQAGAQSSFQLAAGVAHFGVLGLLLGDGLGRLSGMLQLLGKMWRGDRAIFRSVSRQSVVSAARRYSRFPLVSSISAMINTGGLALPTLLLAGYYGPEVLGWFGLMDRAMGLPSMLIGQAVAQVYMRTAAAHAVDDPASVMRIFKKGLGRLAIPGIVPHALIAVLGPVLFATVFGAGWRESGVFAAAIAGMYYVSFVAWPLMPTLNVLELQHWQLLWDIGRLLLVALALVSSHLLHLSPVRAIECYGAAMAAGYITHITLCYIAIRQRCNVDAALR